MPADGACVNDQQEASARSPQCSIGELSSRSADSGRYIDLLPGLSIGCATVGFGRLGLNGDMGFNTVTANAVIHPRFRGDEWHFVSAHAPSRMEIFAQQPVILVGFLNASSWHSPANPVEFWVDNNLIGSGASACDGTSEKYLDAGVHTLEAIQLGANNHGRHSIWAVKLAAGCASNRLISERATPHQLAVVTIACYPDRIAKDMLRPLATSALQKNIQLHVFGIGEQFHNFFHAKVRRLREWIAKLRDTYTHVLYVDARDVVFQGDLQEVCDAFNAFESPIVIGTEPLPWPVRHHAYAKLFPQLTGGRNYPSAGVFMGDRTALENALQKFERVVSVMKGEGNTNGLPDLGSATNFETTEDQRRTIDDDQFLWHIAYLNQLVPIAADARGRLVTNAGFDERKLVPRANCTYSVVGGRLIHKETGCSPPILHFPGIPAQNVLHGWAGYLGLI